MSPYFTSLAMNTTLTLTLSDGVNTKDVVIDIEVINLPPIFLEDINNLAMNPTEIVKLVLPIAEDPEGNGLTITYDSPKVSFANFSQSGGVNAFIINPQLADCGTFSTVYVSLFDGAMTSNH
jgi:hypothetical protein